jgi:hypothetical protein
VVLAHRMALESPLVRAEAVEALDAGEDGVPPPQRREQSRLPVPDREGPKRR